MIRRLLPLIPALACPLAAAINPPDQVGITNGGGGTEIVSPAQLISEMGMLPGDTLDGTLTYSFALEYTSLANGTGQSGFCGLQLYAGNAEGFAIGDNWPSANWGGFQAPGTGNFDLHNAANQTVPLATNSPKTIQVTIEFNPGEDDVILVLFDGRETDFIGQVTFDSVRVRCGNGGHVASFTDISFNYVPDTSGGPDNDGMDDAWETAHGLNPNIDDSQLDPDGDRLSNIAEFTGGTHPQLLDSDNDGFSDGLEAASSSSPTDGGSVPSLLTPFDGVGIMDGNSDITIIDPASLAALMGEQADDSASGLLTASFDLNFSQLANGTGENGFAGFQFHQGNAERLGIGDYWTGTNWGGYQAPGQGDFDLLDDNGQPQALAAGVTRSFVVTIEFLPGSDDLITITSGDLSQVFVGQIDFDRLLLRCGGGGQVANFTNITLSYGTNDKDEDGLPGGWEAAHSLDDLDDGSTNPDYGANGDPDGDGLTNLTEYQNGTNPRAADSDADGFDDAEELAAGTNPNNPGSFPGVYLEPGVVGVENFDYDNGNLAGKGGGLYWDFDNSTSNDPFTGHTGDSDAWQNVGGAPTVVDGTLRTQESSALRTYHATESTGAFGNGASRANGVIYYSFRMNRAAGATWSGASSYDNGAERLLFGTPFVANPSSGQREYAIHNLDAGQWAYSGIQPVPGQDALLVGKMDFTTGMASLYLNPDLSQPENSQTPVATLAFDNNTLSGAIRFGSGGSAPTTWDDVRVATSWDGLTEAAPESNADTMTLHHGGKVRFPILANDGGFIDPTSLAITTAPVFGSASIDSDGYLVYTHESGQPGSDSLVYEIANPSGQATSQAAVTFDFTAASRFETDYLNVPANPPATSLALTDAFPGITFDSPHGFSAIPGHPDKLLVAEGDGRIWILTETNTSTPSKTLVLDITDRVFHDNNERALKGIAAHPQWSANGSIFVTYNSQAGTVRLSRFELATTAPFAGGSETILIDQQNEDSIHNIGTCRFGPDGYLYAAFGDEGTQADGHGNSQHIDKDLWSGIIRIDVDKLPGNLEPNADSDIPRDGGVARFSVPADNPFVGATSFNGVAVNPTEVRTELFAVGFRNPWSFSVEDNNGDRVVDELWVGDVGRNDREEVTVVTPGGNGGWAWYEGTLPGVRSGQTINGAPESAATLTAPLWDYARGGGTFQGASVTGGFVYRSNALPQFTGKYVFADYVSGNIWSLDRTGSNGPVVERVAGEVAIVGLLEDPATGDILLLDRGNAGGNQGTGSIRRLTLNSTDSAFPTTLSQTNFFSDLADFTPNPGGHHYEPHLRFWSDFAEKSRWFAIPSATDAMAFERDGAWDYPAGTVFVKHFDYPTQWETFTRTVDGQNVTDRRPLPGSPSRRIETRFLVRNTTGAYGVSYQWENIPGGTQEDATLASNNGESFDIPVTIDGLATTVPWQIPSRSSCLTCHTPEAGHALSFNTRQLNTEGSLLGESGNFLGLLESSGYLTGLTTGLLPRHVRPDEGEYSLQARARSYLDVNCAYCHQADGTGGGNWDGSHALALSATGMVNGATIDTPLDPAHRLLIPGSASQSVIFNRAAAANGYSRMPPLATTEVDWEGVQLLADWINQELVTPVSYDAWRLEEFGDGTSPEGLRSADPDQDGASNEYEWLTGTNPLDSNEIWRPGFGVAGGEVVLDLPSLPNRVFHAERSVDLLNWIRWDDPANDGIPRAPGTSLFLTTPTTEAREFFRLVVEER